MSMEVGLAYCPLCSKVYMSFEEICRACNFKLTRLKATTRGDGEVVFYVPGT